MQPKRLAGDVNQHYPPVAQILVTQMAQISPCIMFSLIQREFSHGMWVQRPQSSCIYTEHPPVEIRPQLPCPSRAVHHNALLSKLFCFVVQMKISTGFLTP